MKNSTKILAAMALGLAAGGLLGLFFAPDKGEETRKKVARKGREMMDTINEEFSKEKIAGMKEKLENKLQNLGNKIDEFSKEDSISA